MIDTEGLKEEVINLDKDNKTFIPLTMDKMFKGIFKNNNDLLLDFIKCILNLNININNIQLLDTELSKNKYNEYQKIVDILLSINNEVIVNIEINRDYFKNVVNRNFMFANKIQTLMIKTGNTLNNINNMKFYQININAREKFNNKSIGYDTVMLYGLDSKSIYNYNIKYLIKYIDYYRYLYYNVDRKLTKSELWLALLSSKSYQELYDISSKFLNEEKQEKLIRSVINMNNADFTLEDYEIEYLNKMVERDTRKNLIEEYELKLDEKDKQLENQNKQLENKDKQLKKSIINMFKEGFDNTVISRITGKSTKEIEKILMLQ